MKRTVKIVNMVQNLKQGHHTNEPSIVTPSAYFFKNLNNQVALKNDEAL
jgi:hypothetical protein